MRGLTQNLQNYIYSVVLELYLLVGPKKSVYLVFQEKFVLTSPGAGRVGVLEQYHQLAVVPSYHEVYLHYTRALGSRLES